MKQPPWQWAAQGKHPVVNDYIRLGRDFSLVSVFADWVRNGYGLVSCRGIPSPSGLTGCCGQPHKPERESEKATERKGERATEREAATSSPASCVHSFRFWTRGSAKDMLVCGLVRDSSDRLGRPYPLLIMGTGPLPGWEERWDLVSLACERSWSQMEHLAASAGGQGTPVADRRHLEDGILAIKPPRSQWSCLSQEKEACSGLSCDKSQGLSCDPEQGLSHDQKQGLSHDQGQGPGLSGNPVETAGRTPDFSKDVVLIGLDQEKDYDCLSQISLWHRFLKNHHGSAGGRMPKAVFMGGTVGNSSLAFFQRPLKPADFMLLWSF
ncbi:MAG: hypothetical protein AB1847_03020 [bacterium]